MSTISASPQAGLWHYAASALLVSILLLAAGWLAHTGADQSLVLSLLGGGVFGYVLQRSRFCFYCLSTDYFSRRDARGLIGIVATLAAGLVAYYAIFGAFLPEPAPERLPPGAHIGPVSVALLAGAGAFGFGMALAGSCISAQLYRLGEGAFGNLFALAGAGLGFVLGFYSWNTLYLNSIQSAPVVWLPTLFGYGGSLLLQLLVLLGLFLFLVYTNKPVEEQGAKSIPQAIFKHRWPVHVGGLIIALLAALAYLRVAPLGVTAELGSIARTLGNPLPGFPERLEGLDTFRGCAAVIKETLLSPNGLFVAALVLGSAAAALPAGDWSPRLPDARSALRLFSGGVLMGWGAQTALGCTVGTLLSGIMAGALSGWVFAIACLLGAWLGWKARHWR